MGSGFIRLLTLATLVWIGWMIYRRMKAGLQQRITDASAPSPPQIKMLQCEQCGLHIPANEAIQTAGGHVYCCETHRRQSGQ